ncbi:Gfo/Idh/MocA family protein [Pararobbsia silviterrae]|uniref:Gfo/Idh/MocA family oxidoreductase n=1 Tax=Pararobbsia silviterrae TaxID=1792498 RepID=A0A494XVE6_9BURK|nr:Gfo/Idh/MocA family oxidoreductase [Pararobbsia silviterrae]RKP54548.1 gfo/Idh/MocA family oxidoreductase [Pararobbsia silviterrae]
MDSRFEGLRQRWPLPARPRPIAIVGAGAIVRDAHLPAYRLAGFEVVAIHDRDRAKARALADAHGIATVCDSLDELAATPDAVFDIAVVPEANADVLAHLPPGAAVLIQKPMGRSLAEARAIVEVCERRSLSAAVNFQLRFSPMMLALRDALERGLLGEVLDVEVRLACRTPWELWPFMSNLAQVEVPMHSIHYLDLIRSLFGEPRSALSRSVAHPDYPALRDARTSTILDFDAPIRCCLSLNHTYRFGPDGESATIRVEGTRGAAEVGLGLLLNYPNGEPETLRLVADAAARHAANASPSAWTAIPLEGRWFPHAFIGTMSNLQRFAAGEDPVLHTSVRDALRTMALVDACARSSAQGGVRPEHTGDLPSRSEQHA